MIPYSRQTIDDKDIAAVIEVFRGDWLTQGPHIGDFESAIADVTGAKYAVAFANGTAALHAALAISGVGPGDSVCTSPLSFVASANSARYCGASVTFADIDMETLNLMPAVVPAGTAALVAVHFSGLPVDLSSLRQRPRVVVEDAAHALGASTPDGPVGNCAYSDMCVFSFHPVKAITSGEGGMVTTNSEAFARDLRRFRHHGITPTPERGGWCYDVESLGWNYRMTDIQAALGRSQLDKLETFVMQRNGLADRYRVLLSELPVLLPPRPALGVRHAYHLFTVRVPRRDEVFEKLRANGVGVQVHYSPIHLHSLYRREGYGAGSFPNAERVSNEILSLPLFPTLTEEAQNYVVKALAEACAD